MKLEQMLKALGEPTRLKIYFSLFERKHCVRSLSRKLGISESAVSQHMKQLREAGLVYGEKYGYHTHYLPVQKAVDELAGAFTDMQSRSSSLDRDMTSCQCEFKQES